MEGGPAGGAEGDQAGVSSVSLELYELVLAESGLTEELNIFPCGDHSGCFEAVADTDDETRAHHHSG